MMENSQITRLKRLKEIENKSNQVAKTHEEILKLNDSISKISATLKHAREKEKDLRLTTARLVTRHSTVKIDQEKRPSDRDFGVRPYSKMDQDVWRFDQLRGWFNAYAGDQDTKYELTPAQTGYMLKID